MKFNQFFNAFVCLSFISLSAMKSIDLIPAATQQRMNYIYLKHLVATSSYEELEKFLHIHGTHLVDQEIRYLAHSLSRTKLWESHPAVETKFILDMYTNNIKVVTIEEFLRMKGFARN